MHSRKGIRSRFDRRKNDTREVGCSQTQLQVIQHPLPQHWQSLGRGQYCKLEMDVTTAQCKLTASLFVDSENGWKVHVNGKRVPSTCNLLEEFPQDMCTSNSAMIAAFIDCLDTAFICPGNSDEKFVIACENKGGIIRTNRGSGETVAYIDRVPTTDWTGKLCNCTIRRVDCDIICESRGLYPHRCKSCNTFRSTLRASFSRLKDNEDHTLSTSHTNYAKLSPDEKDERLRNLHKSVVSAKQRLSKMKSKVMSMIESESVLLEGEDSADMTSIAAEITPHVENAFPADSPQRIFWDQQVQYNQLTDKRQIRWHPLVIRFALNFKYLSSSAYRAVRQSGILHLPSERTLSDYTHWSLPHSGVQLEFIEQLCTQLEDVKSKQRHCTISMDEMKIKSGLVFNKHTGTLVGFVDIGNVNKEIELIMSESTDQDSPTGKTYLPHQSSVA